MKKWITMLLFAFVLFSGFVACSDTPKDNPEKKVSTNAELIIGTWETEVDMTDMMMAIFESNEEMAQFIDISDFKMKFYFTFQENLLMARKVDETMLSESVDRFFAGIKEGMHDYYESMIQESELEMTVEELLEKSDTDLDTLVENMSKAAMDAMKFDEMSYDCYYEVRFNHLYFYDSEDERNEEEYIKIEFVDEDTMKFVDVNIKEEGNILNLITGLKKVKE